MNNKKAIFGVLMFMGVLATPVMLVADPVDLYKTKSTNHHGKNKIPAKQAQVTADVENNVVKVNINRYNGVIYVYLYNSDNNQIAAISSVVDGQGSLTIDMGDIESGTYSIEIVCDCSYYGIFKI